MADTKSVRICGMMKTTLLDFPGKVACTLFLAGCNMRCPFCHNPRVVYGNDEIINTEEVFSFLKKRRGILDGVCITGGEPTLYGDPLITFIKEMAKNLKFQTQAICLLVTKLTTLKNLLSRQIFMLHQNLLVQ